MKTMNRRDSGNHNYKRGRSRGFGDGGQNRGNNHQNRSNDQQPRGPRSEPYHKPFSVRDENGFDSWTTPLTHTSHGHEQHNTFGRPPNQNGQTNHDRSRYFQAIPPNHQGRQLSMPQSRCTFESGDSTEQGYQPTSQIYRLPIFVTESPRSEETDEDRNRRKGKYRTTPGLSDRRDKSSRHTTWTTTDVKMSDAPNSSDSRDYRNTDKERLNNSPATQYLSQMLSKALKRKIEPSSFSNNSKSARYSQEYGNSSNVGTRSVVTARTATSAVCSEEHAATEVVTDPVPSTSYKYSTRPPSPALAVGTDIEPVPSTSYQPEVVVSEEQRIISETVQMAVEDESDDQRPCTEDQFIENNRRNQYTEPKEKEPCFHPEQMEMAEVLYERIEEILFRNEHSLRSVHAYKNFDFIIYTARSKMLEQQTVRRLCDPDTECFPESVYCGTADDVERYAKEKVWMFTVEHIEKAHKQMKAKVRENPNTLFLVIGDEAHSAITKKAGVKKMPAANNTVINSWNAREHPNVIVLQVTATPFNLLSKRTRIPETVVAKPLHLDVCETPTEDECSDSALVENGRKLKNVNLGGWGSHKLYLGKHDVTAEYSLPAKLHHARWSEQLLRRLASATGVVMRIQVPSKEMNWLMIDQHSDRVVTTDKVEMATELLFQGQNGIVTIKTLDDKWQLVVYNEKVDGKSHIKVGFMNMETFHIKSHNSPTSEYNESFRMMLNYGEDIFQLEATMTNIHNTQGQATRKSLKYDIKKEQLVVGVRDKSDDYSVAGLVPSSIEHSFFIDTKRNVGDTHPNATYISLNRIYNSMRYVDYDKHLLRFDESFQDICHHVESLNEGSKFTDAKLTDVYAAVFAYWILIVENFERYKSAPSQLCKSFDALVQHGLRNYRREYTDAHTQSLRQLEEKLRCSRRDDTDYPCIQPEIFQAVKGYYRNLARRKLVEKMSGSQSHAEFIEEVWEALTLCLIHMDVDALRDVETNVLCDNNIKHAEKKKHLLNRAFKKKFNFFHEAGKVFEEEESCKVVSQLIQPFRSQDENSDVKGKMVIVKVLSVQDGNRLYKTVCIARELMQKQLDYTFDLMRDYGTFDITSVNTDTNEPLFRVRKKLQPKQCQHRGKDGRRCKCEDYSTRGSDLRCTSEHCKGRHKHREVHQYEDMRNLSCLLILLKKGRLGDTFPDSFTTLDLRITTTRKPHNFALIMQDLGRMCRYVKDNEQPPKALMGSGLEDILSKWFDEQAVFHAAFIMLKEGEQKERGKKKSNLQLRRKDCIPLDYHVKWDPKGGVMPDVDSFDHDNLECVTHGNRLLLEAEPQIGKSGVFFYLASMLRKKTCRNAGNEGQEIVFEDNEEERRQLREIPIDTEKWKYPYWRDISEEPALPKRLSTGNGTPFVYDKRPTALPNSELKEGVTKIPVHPNILNKSSFLAETSRHSLASCTKCKDLRYTTSSLVGYTLADQRVDISVPDHEYFAELRQALDSPMNFAPHINIGRRERLFTWIFTPVRHGRCNKGNLNLRHTMVDLDSAIDATVPYVHVLVVAEDEFEEYRKQWRSTHAIVKMPHANANEGTTRRFVLELAMSLGLDKIFIMDDNIPYVYTCITEHNGQEVRVRSSTDKEFGVKNIPLFDVLKHLESQFDPEQPVGDVVFVPHDNCEPDTLQEYTGPCEMYGILGVCNNLKQQAKARKGFEKALLSSLMLLNVAALGTNGITYQSWPLHADFQLNVESDKKNLASCRYNRYVMAKSVVRAPPVRRRHPTQNTSDSDNTDGESSGVNRRPLSAAPAPAPTAPTGHVNRRSPQSARLPVSTVPGHARPGTSTADRQGSFADHSRELEVSDSESNLSRATGVSGEELHARIQALREEPVDVDVPETFVVEDDDINELSRQEDIMEVFSGSATPSSSGSMSPEGIDTDEELTDDDDDPVEAPVTQSQDTDGEENTAEMPSQDESMNDCQARYPIDSQDKERAEQEMAENTQQTTEDNSQNERAIAGSPGQILTAVDETEVVEVEENQTEENDDEGYGEQQRSENGEIENRATEVSLTCGQHETFDSQTGGEATVNTETDELDVTQERHNASNESTVGRAEPTSDAIFSLDHLNRMRDALMAAKRRIMEVEAEKEKLNEGNKRLNDKNASLNEEKSSLNVKNTRLSGENSKLNDENAHLSGENNSLKEQKERLSGQNSNLKKDNERLSGENSYLNEENESLSGENNSLKEENERLRENSVAWNEERRKLGEENSRLKNENTTLRQDKRHFANEKRNLSEENIKYFSDKVMYESKILELNREILEHKQNMHKVLNKEIEGMVNKEQG